MSARHGYGERRLHPAGWTDERVANLKRLWTEGKSAGEIAKILGGGATRNGCIGKARRLGLPPHSAYVKRANLRAASLHTGKRSKAPPKPQLIVAGNGAVIEKAEAPPPRVELPMRDDKPGPHACTLVQLAAHACRWPIGPTLAPAELFCGEPLDPQRDTDRPPYCRQHMARAHQPAQPNKKRSANELARSLRRYV